MTEPLTDLPDGWVWTTLGEACLVIMGQSPPSSTYNKKGIGLPFYQGKAEFGDLHPSPVKWCSEPKKTAEQGDVLISIRAPVGPTNLANETCSIGRGLAALRPEVGMDGRYFLYFLRMIENDWDEYTTGTTFEAISGDRLSSRPAPLAPLKEQHRIVEAIESYFTRLDAAEAALRRAQARLAQYKSALLKAACEGRLVPTEAELARQEGRTYEPADDLLAKILKERRAKWEAEEWARLVERARERALADARKTTEQTSAVPLDDAWLDVPETAYARYLPKDDNWKAKYQEPVQPDVEGLPALPEGWCWVNLNQLSWHSGYGTSVKCDYDSSGPPVVRIPNISNNRIDLTDLKYAAGGANLRKTDALAPGDILIVRTNGSLSLIGRSALVSKQLGNDDRGYYFASYLIRFRLVPNNTINVWVSTIWDSSQIRAQIMERASTTAGQYNVNIPTLGGLTFPLPPSVEQHRIIAEVDQLFSLIDVQEKSLLNNLARATRIRQAILRTAYRGELVAHDTTDKPASTLLEEIEIERKNRAEAEAMDRKKRAKSKADRGKKVSKKAERKPLLEVLETASSMLSPEELFDRAGYTVALVDEFYNELRSLVPNKVSEFRVASGTIELKVIEDANQTA